MASMRRFKTTYPGVFYILGKSIATGKQEKIYYIRYRKNRKEIEEKAGRQFQDDMTPARAATKRAQRIGGELSNKAQREAIGAAKKAKTDKWTINRLWEEYKTQHTLKGLVQDENRYKNYIKGNFGSKEPHNLIPLDVDRLRINLLKKKSPQTVKHILTLLRRIINFGVNKHLCQGLNFRIEMPSVDNEKTEDLTPEQLEKLIQAIDIDTHRDAANLMKLCLFTGMRRGELFRLQWQHIDFHRGFINIVDSKGGQDQKIPMNDGTRQVLESHLRTDSPYVFPGRGGKQRTEIKRPVNRIKERAGLPKDFRPLHGLRHVYASMLASSGQVDMYTLQKLLTHKSPAMTQRYAHLRDDALQRASNLAGDIISQAMNGNKEKKVANLEDKRK
jgi:integrase